MLPKDLSKAEFASTINASINTCLVLTSISLTTLSTTSKSFSLPLTIIDLVVFSSVTCIGTNEDPPALDVNNSVSVALASAGDI